MANGKKIKRPVTEEDIREWERGWTDMMVKIWQENMLRLKIFDTGRLYNRMTGTVTDASGLVTICHQFLLYGIYVARGVGNGYRRGNSGKDDDNGLKFLGKQYRKEHNITDVEDNNSISSNRFRDNDELKYLLFLKSYFSI